MCLDTVPDTVEFRGEKSPSTVDFSYQEIAEVLDVPVGPSVHDFTEGRKMLQKAFWHAAQEAGIVGDLQGNAVSR